MKEKKCSAFLLSRKESLNLQKKIRREVFLKSKLGVQNYQKEKK